MKRLKPVLIIAATFFLHLVFVAQSHSSPTEIAVAASQPYTHGQTGLIFPPSINTYVRDKVVQYYASSKDVGVGYNLNTQESIIAATVFVYPA